MDEIDVVSDIKRMDWGDKEIEARYESLRTAHRLKGLPYRELMGSKHTNCIKYLVTDRHNGDIEISDLDTGDSWNIK